MVVVRVEPEFRGSHPRAPTRVFSARDPLGSKPPLSMFAAMWYKKLHRCAIHNKSIDIISD